jgi:hypothetical protein
MSQLCSWCATLFVFNDENASIWNGDLFVDSLGLATAIGSPQQSYEEHDEDWDEDQPNEDSIVLEIRNNDTVTDWERCGRGSWVLTKGGKENRRG